MKLSDFDYNLPEELIAQTPAEPRDHCRLLVLDKKSGEVSHHIFGSIVDFLNPGDLLVLNNSKVFPARLFGRRENTGGKIEILLHKNIGASTWEVIGKNLRPNTEILFDKSKLEGLVIVKNENISAVEFNLSGEDFFAEIEKIGHTPLPPYIKKKITQQDKEDYQTVFAKERGSVAAPTAGLHFTDQLLEDIKHKGIEIAKVILHVGIGTFGPVKTDNILEHKMHSEYYTVIQDELKKIIKAKKEGRRVIAVGTTTTRVLETIFSAPDSLLPTPDLTGWTDIFIYPGYKFNCIDGLITNFHLPKSTLLMLVSALAGKENVLKAYEEAIEKKYRFFSYGDAMLIV